MEFTRIKIRNPYSIVGLQKIINEGRDHLVDMIYHYFFNFLLVRNNLICNVREETVKCIDSALTNNSRANFIITFICAYR